MKTTKLIPAGLALLLAAGLAACRDPKVASKATFKKALARYHQENPLVISNMFLKLPVLETDKSFRYNREFVEIFGGVGYLAGRDTMVEVDSAVFDPRSWSPRMVKVRKPTKVWDLSEEGRKHFLSEDNAMVGKVYGFKWADLAVKEVLSYSEPADLMGKKVSEASYTVELVHQAPWVEKLKGKPTFASELAILNKIRAPLKAPLVLTSEGWVDGRGL